jgi:2-polyprenyl-3-methyl-5-hydroxy-6-metoxy-1,4-benzoquinol methylase
MRKIKQFAKFVRKLFTFWVTEYDINHLHELRNEEFNYIVKNFPERKKSVLEIGAGTGWQSKLLSERGYNVKAIDLPTSNYKTRRIWDVIDYNGEKIPFGESTFDIVFSSNVMEHVPHVTQIQDEIHRILKRDGILIHVMPTTTWRILTNITHVIKYWSKPTIHGVHSRTLREERYFFSSENWRNILCDNNFELKKVYNIPLLYSGNSILGKKLLLRYRFFLAKYLGGSCNIYVLNLKNKS